MDDRIYKLIEKRVIESNPHRKRSKRQLKEDTEKEIPNLTNDKVKLVIAHVIYNDEDFLESVLEDDLKIPDLDMIHIIDGAWEHGGKSVNSTDKTKEIVENFAKRTEVPVVFVENETGKLWESESVKRNVQLDMIGKLFPNDRCYVFVKDGDEYFRFNSGRELLWIKPVLDEAYPELGMIRAYAYESNKGGKTPRMIAVNQGIHYYTEKSMCIHNKNHELMIDYNFIGEPTVTRAEPKVFYMEEFFLMNRWNKRNAERIEEKNIFNKFRDTQDYNTEGCRYEV